MIKRILGMLLSTGFVFLLLPHVVSAARVNFSPSSVSLTESQNRVVTVTLDEPIICADPGPPCQVSLAISTNAPDRVTIDTSPVVFASNQWFQAFTFTVTAVDDSLVNGDITPTISIVNTSGSEYYNGFVPTFSISILDNDVSSPAPTITDVPANVATSTAEQELPTLASTGQNQQKYVLLAATLLLIPVMPVLILKRKHRRK